MDGEHGEETDGQKDLQDIRKRKLRTTVLGNDT